MKNFSKFIPRFALVSLAFGIGSFFLGAEPQAFAIEAECFVQPAGSPPVPCPVDGSNNPVVSDPSVVNAINTSSITGLNGCAGASISNTKTKPFSNAGTSTTLKLVAGVASQNVHICAVNVGPVAGTAVNVVLVEGTGTLCATGTVGLMGGATAATGWNFPINGGLAFGNGMGLIAITATPGDDVCILFSAGVQVSGVITYAVFP